MGLSRYLARLIADTVQMAGGNQGDRGDSLFFELSILLVGATEGPNKN